MNHLSNLSVEANTFDEPTTTNPLIVDDNYLPTTCLAAGVIDNFFGAIYADSYYISIVNHWSQRLFKFMKKSFPQGTVMFGK